MNDLRDLLHDAVADVEPADRLRELRARTADPARAAARPWFWAAGATVLATAAAVAVVAILSNGSDAPRHHHHDMALDPPASTQLVAAYFIGDSADGPRLFREFDEVPVGDPLQAALDRIERPASDPDYSTTWTAGSFGGVTQRDDGIHVEVDDPAAVLPNDLALQQVVYTLQAAASEQLPVWFWREKQRGNAPVTAAPQVDVLNPVSISDPAEGNAYSGSMIARGRAEPSGVLWHLSDSAGRIVRQGVAASSTSGTGLRPWKVTVDLDGLEPGDFTFAVLTTDTITPGQTTFLSSTDTRTISVR
ncbi:hypothetical protein GCM10023350_41620 [Nocardioides endophyticus]|uniref:Bacterial spore germination immunoglobulin-like domain-containing protein n=1 Tax=Nocardioides endophyticus TaxID=1353775 RepID=A0ABP8ZBP5_9ACTN